MAYTAPARTGRFASGAPGTSSCSYVPKPTRGSTVGLAPTGGRGSHSCRIADLTEPPLEEATDIIRDGLQSRLDEMGLGAVAKPDRPASEAPVEAEGDRKSPSGSWAVFRGRAVAVAGPVQAASCSRVVAEAKPRQVCRFPAQHHPTFGASRFALPSRPIPLLIHTAGVRASSAPLVFLSSEPMVMKQRTRARMAGS